MESAFERLLSAARELKPSLIANKSDLAKYLNESPQSITNWQTRGIPKSKLLSVARAIGISVEWLETGQGRMEVGGISPEADEIVALLQSGKLTASIRSPASTPSIPAGASISTYETVDELDPDSYVLVDRYDVQLSAGCGNIQWVMNEKDPISFRARWFQQKRLNPGNCKALYVRGRSMEPKLEDWDTVLIDTAQTDIVDGEIYAVCLEDEFFIKTVQRIAGGMLLKSENPDFANIEVTGERMATLCIIGKKVWRGG